MPNDVEVSFVDEVLIPVATEKLHAFLDALGVATTGSITELSIASGCNDIQHQSRVLKIYIEVQEK